MPEGIRQRTRVCTHFRTSNRSCIALCSAFKAGFVAGMPELLSAGAGMLRAGKGSRRLEVSKHKD